MQKDSQINNIEPKNKRSPNKMVENYDWDNNTNAQFYNLITPVELQKFAKKGGLNSGCDLHCLEPYWTKASSILEVGAGYGRVIDCLTRRGYSGRITAIERSQTLLQALQKKYHDNPNVALLELDTHNCDQIAEKFDLILFLWSGLADFSAEEQPKIVKGLSRLLTKGGKLIIDNFLLDRTPLNAVQLKKQTYAFMLNNLTKYIYEPSVDEINEYAENAGLSYRKILNCTSDAIRNRQLHVLVNL